MRIVTLQEKAQIKSLIDKFHAEFTAMGKRLNNGNVLPMHLQVKVTALVEDPEDLEMPYTIGQQGCELGIDSIKEAYDAAKTATSISGYLIEGVYEAIIGLPDMSFTDVERM